MPYDISGEVLVLAIGQLLTLLTIIVGSVQFNKQHKLNTVATTADAANDTASATKTMWDSYDAALDALLERDKKLIVMSGQIESLTVRVQGLESDYEREKARGDKLQVLLDEEIEKRRALQREREELRQEINELREELSEYKRSHIPEKETPK